MEGRPVQSTARGRRVDACRNHERIIRAATVLLARRPGASMAELTAATGLGRTTVYRHFRARELLVAEVYTTAFTRTRRMIDEADLDSCSQAELLERTVAVLIRATETYPVLVHGPAADALDDADRVRDARAACLDALSRVVRRAQRTKVLDASLPPHWLAELLLDDCVAAVPAAPELRALGHDPTALVRTAFERAWSRLPRRARD